MRYIDNHVYLQVNIPHKILRNQLQFKKMNKNLFHQSSEKIFKLISRAHSDRAAPETADF